MNLIRPPEKIGKENSNELMKSLVVSELAVLTWVMTLKLSAENYRDSLSVPTSTEAEFPEVA